MRLLALVAMISASACNDRGASPVDGAEATMIGNPEQALSASCSGCHLEGGSAISDPTRWTEQTILSRMRYYKDDVDGTTVMHRIARGYSDEELVSISAFLGKKDGAEP